MRSESENNSTNRIFFVVIPVIFLSLIFSGVVFFYIFKRNVSNVVYKDLMSLSKSNSLYTSELMTAGIEKEKVLTILDETFKKHTFAKNGFSFVVDLDGNLLVHRVVGKINWLSEPHIKQIVREKNGFVRYLSPKTKTFKIAAFSYVPEANFIIVASDFEDDFIDEPMREIIKFLIVSMLAVAFVGVISFTLILGEREKKKV